MNFINSLKSTIIETIGRKYLNGLLRNEYLNQKYITFNERPVEYSFVFKQLVKYCPQTILDVGTGITSLPQLMRTCGFMVTAIDNVKDYWPDGMFNRHYYIIDDDILNSKLEQKFDLITCISTLEHIVNFEKAINTMFDLLTPNGKIVLSFPYNEKTYCENVYNLKDSSASPMPFITQAFSRQQLTDWCKNNDAEIVDQEYWKYFTGDYWTVGERMKIPMQVESSDKHQISCITLKKIL